MSVNTLDVPQKSPPDTPSPTTNDLTLTEDSNYIGAADRMLDNEQPLDDPHDDKTDGTETDQDTRFNDLPKPSVDIDGKHAPDDQPPTRSNNYIGAADRMLDNEQPLDDSLNETDSDVDSPPAVESSMGNNTDAEFNGDTYHHAGDIRRSAAADINSPNNDGFGDIEQMLNQEQPLDNNDSTIESDPQQKSTEAADKTNSDPAAEEIRELPSPVVEDQLRSSLEGLDTIGQDSEPQHPTDQQPNQPFADQQLTESNDAKPTQFYDGFPLTEVDQLDDKTVEAKETVPVDTDWEFSAIRQESAAGSYPYSGDFPEESGTSMDSGSQGLLLQQTRGLDLEPSGVHDIGVTRAGQWLPDAPISYMDPLQIKPEPQTFEPVDPGNLPTGDTPSADNDNLSNERRALDNNPPLDNSSHNADGTTVVQLTSASSTKVNSESTSDDHVAPGATETTENSINCAADEVEDTANNDVEDDGDEDEGIREAHKKVPNEWGDGQPNRRKIGHRWVDPNNPKESGVRIDKGNPNNSLPNQRVDHVIVRKGGEVIGRDGKPIKGSIKADADNSHIPLKEWLRWLKWDTP